MRECKDEVEDDNDGDYVFYFCRNVPMCCRGSYGGTCISREDFREGT